MVEASKVFQGELIKIEIYPQERNVWVSFTADLDYIDLFNDSIAEVLTDHSDEPQILVSNWENCAGGFQCNYSESSGH